MKSRLDCVKAYADDIFDQIESPEVRRAAYVHSYGVSQCCALLAAKRGLEVELAAIIGLLHDVYRFKTGVNALHAQSGAEMMRVTFKYSLKDLFTDDEQTILKSAIFHHSDKAHVHDEYDELLKDGDVLQHFPFDAAFGAIESKRLLRVMEELSLPSPEIAVLPEEGGATNVFTQSRAGDIAETLAAKKIVGARTDADYMHIIRYFPEETACDELKGAWCAAFVFHCCAEAGLKLPIRVPDRAGKTPSFRLASVVAWYEWGMENGFCFFEKDGFTPQRGDIVIFNNIIPQQDKPENSTWCDHTGIVVGCDADSIMVAEGNADNKNVSGILCRKRDETIGCYIRVPDGYVYDGWIVDFKTGEIRQENLCR